MPSNSNEFSPNSKREISPEGKETQPNEQTLNKALSCEGALENRDERLRVLTETIKDPTAKKSFLERLNKLKDKFGPAIAITAFLTMSQGAFAQDAETDADNLDTNITTIAPIEEILNIEETSFEVTSPATKIKGEYSEAGAMINTSLAVATGLFASTVKSAITNPDGKTNDSSILSRLASITGSNTIGNMVNGYEYYKYVNTNLLAEKSPEKKIEENEDVQEKPLTVDEVLSSVESLPSFASPILSKLASLASAIKELKKEKKEVENLKDGEKSADEGFSFKKLLGIVVPLIPQARAAMIISGVWDSIQEIRGANTKEAKITIAKVEEKVPSVSTEY